MALTSQCHEDHLRGLKRPELQRLAKEHKIKANLKSNVIIDLLLHRLAEAAKPQAEGVPSGAQHAISMPSPVDDGSLRGRLGKRLVSIPTNSNPMRSFEAPVDTSTLNQHSKDSIHPAQDRGRMDSGSLFNIDKFDKEQSPTPESLVKETVAMLAELDKGDQQLMDQIVNMRKAISKLRSQTRNTRALLRSENARRRRAVQYYLYWHPITSNWSYNEVWSGTVDVHDEATGDEEGCEEENAESNKITTNPKNLHPHGSRIFNSIERTNVNGSPEDGALLSPIGVPVVNFETMGKKRLRSHSPSDNRRHAPRRRVEDDPSMLTGSNETPPILAGVDKGKAKMTTEQVEQLERENEVERLLAEISAGLHHKITGGDLQPIRERATPEEHVDSNCFGEDKVAALEVQPSDSRKDDGEAHVEFKMVEYPNIDYDSLLTMPPAEPLTEVVEAQACIIEPDRNRDQGQEPVKTGVARKALQISTFSPSHQPQYTRRTTGKQKRTD